MSEEVKTNDNFDVSEKTQIESATLELELIGADERRAQRASVALRDSLSALGATETVSRSKDGEIVRIRVNLYGPKAVDRVYYIENLVSFTKFGILLITYFIFKPLSFKILL